MSDTRAEWLSRFMSTEEDPIGGEADARPAVRCPICGRPAEPALFARHVDLHPVVREALSILAPGWRPADGACPVCVDRALAALTSSGHDLGRVLLHAAAYSDNPLVAAAGDPA